MIVKSSSLSGKIVIPPSKSQTMRAILFAALANGKSHIKDPLSSPDVDAMVVACERLGAKIDVKAEEMEIVGVGGKPFLPDDVIDAKNSGQVLRFVGAISALCQGWTVITGDASIRFNRPAYPLIEGLNQLGATAFSTKGDGRAPLVIKGPMRGGKAVISGEDSQPVSGLLMAAIFADQKTELNVLSPGEKPWVNLTLSWFDRLGIWYKNENFERYEVQGLARYDGFEYRVPGDFSSAAYPLAAALITESELDIKNLDPDEIQGDKKFIDILRQMGADIDPQFRVKRSKLEGIEVDVNDFIDALPILAVLGCYAKGKTVIKGGSIARQKESNRIACIVKELRKMGANIVETEDGVEVYSSELKGAELECYQDHRLCMALICAAFGAKGPSFIKETSSILKSFPGFIHQFENLGAQFEHHSDRL